MTSALNLFCRVTFSTSLLCIDETDPFRCHSIDSTVINRKLKNGGKLFDKIPKRVFPSASVMVSSGSNASSKVMISNINSNIEDINGIVYDECLENRIDVEQETRRMLDKHCLITQLKDCITVGNLGVGKALHGVVIKNGIYGDKFLNTALINLYAKCGDMARARIVFDEIPTVDVASCNCLISGFVCNEQFNQVFGFYQNMGSFNITPNHYTYSIILSYCGNLLAVSEGIQIHAHVTKAGYMFNKVIANSLLTMYYRFGMMVEAQRLFQCHPEKNSLSWTANISGLFQQKAYNEALVQVSMMREDGFELNEYTITTALSCCTATKLYDMGFGLHAQVIKKGMKGPYIGSAIISMYMELGLVIDAEKYLIGMGKSASTVPWNALITGLVKNDEMESALVAFKKMVQNDVSLDEYTFSTVLNACSSLPSLMICKQIHSQIIKAKYDRNLHVASSLIEAYGNSGSLDEAEKIFNQILFPDVVSLNTMIKIYSQYGYAKKAISLYNDMVTKGINPSSSTFLAVVSACTHCGLVQEGEKFFNSMLKDYEITPDEKHYSCMVDLYSRSGHLEKALNFITKQLPINPTGPIWSPLFAACRYYGNIEMGEYVADCLKELDPNDATIYVTLSNMYKDAGRLGDAIEQWEVMEGNGIKKEPGCSWIEANGKTCAFFSGDESHPQVNDRLEKLMSEIMNEGCDLENMFAIT